MSAILKRAGVRLRRSPLRESEIDEAVELYRNGLSLAKVGARLGKTPGTIQRVLSAQGVPTRDSHGRPRTAISAVTR